MKRLNPDTGKPFKKGETDALGFMFLTYSKSRTNKAGYFAENWASPERRATLEAIKKTAIRRVNEETGTQFKRGDLDPTSGKRFFGYKKFITKDGFYGEAWITEAEWQEYLVSKPRLPSKKKLNPL